MQMVHNTYNMYHYIYIYQFNIRLIITVMSQCKYLVRIIIYKTIINITSIRVRSHKLSL